MTKQGFDPQPEGYQPINEQPTSWWFPMVENLPIGNCQKTVGNHMAWIGQEIARLDPTSTTKTKGTICGRMTLGPIAAAWELPPRSLEPLFLFSSFCLGY